MPLHTHPRLKPCSSSAQHGARAPRGAPPLLSCHPPPTPRAPSRPPPHPTPRSAPAPRPPAPNPALCPLVPTTPLCSARFRWFWFSLGWYLQPPPPPPPLYRPSPPHLDGLLRPLGPLQDLLGPVHAHEAVHLAHVHHLQLSRVPQLVVSGAALQLIAACAWLGVTFMMWGVWGWGSGREGGCGGGGAGGWGGVREGGVEVG